MRALSNFRRWLRRWATGYRRAVDRHVDEHLRLEQAFTECAGQWVAVDRRTGAVVAARPNPYELAAHLKENGIRGVDVVRAPDHHEPEVVGIG